VEAQATDNSSTHALYRHMLALRRSSEALRQGSLEFLPAPPGVVLFERSSGVDRKVIAVSFASERLLLGHEGWRVEASSDTTAWGAPFGGVLEPDSAVVLAPP
jgi:alpha-glucosidase